MTDHEPLDQDRPRDEHGSTEPPAADPPRPTPRRRRVAVLRATPTTPDVGPRRPLDDHTSPDHPVPTPAGPEPPSGRSGVPRGHTEPPESGSAVPHPRLPPPEESRPADTSAPAAPPSSADQDPRPDEPRWEIRRPRRSSADDQNDSGQTVDRGDPRPTARAWLSWQRVTGVLLALLVVAALGRGVLQGAGSVSAGKSKGQETTAALPKPHHRTLAAVKLNGVAIAAAGPVLTLNPALAQPGAKISLAGSGFDPRSTVDVLISAKGASTGASVGSVRTDKGGGLAGDITVPESISARSVLVTARQRNSRNVATAEAVTAAGVGVATLSKTTGAPGKTVSVNARGFTARETVKIYWGRASGPTTTTVKAGAAGELSQVPVQVAAGGVGDTTLVLVGVKSGTTATAPFYRLGLYPTAKTSPYALRAGENLSLSGAGFAPDERVLVYVNTSSGTPAGTAHADSQGSLGGIGFAVPFGLRGSQTVIMVGEQSRASVSSGFDVLPYTPTVQASTYGGAAGTTLSFFARDFAPHEVVLVYRGRTKDSTGDLVSAFRVDARGAAGAAGSYRISSQDTGGLSFTLVGKKSGGKARTTVRVSAATGPANVSPAPPYKIPPSLRK